MKAEIKTLHSPDIYDMATWVPPDPACFDFLLELGIGPAGEEGCEVFCFRVVTPLYLDRMCRGRPAVMGRHYIIVAGFCHEELVEFLRKYVGSLDAPDWPSLARLLAQHGQWEFDSYDAG